jgi:predicted metal-dependent peptidase
VADYTQILSAGRFLARKRAPYFRSILLALVTRPMPGLGTVAVTAHGFFLYDPEVIGKWTVEQMAGAWIHESLHKLNLHGKRQGLRDHDRWNIACDLAINTTVRELGLPLPEGSLFPEAMKPPMEPGLPADAYYAELTKRASQQPRQGQGQPGPGGGAEGQQGVPSPGAPACGKGWCGSGGGHAVPNEPEAGDAEARTEGSLERAVRETAEAIKDAASKGRGSVPSSLARWADEALQPPKVPWRQKLGRIARRAVAWSLGAVDHRYDAPSRRQAGIGYGVGRPILPRLRRPVPRVAIAVDTSGAMGRDELRAAAAEVKGVLSATGADVDFMACDAVIHGGVRKVATVEDACARLVGGGGTDFRPVFTAIAELNPRPEILVFITDGCGPAPAAPPPRTQVIWVLIGRYRQTPASWGDVIEVDDLQAP